MKNRGRDSYADAGTAGRAAIERAVTSPYVKPRDWRVLVACLSLTALYSKTHDRTSVGQIARLAGVSVSRTSESLGRLRDLGVIGWIPSSGQGTSRLSLVNVARNDERIIERHAARRTITVSTAVHLHSGEAVHLHSGEAVHLHSGEAVHLHSGEASEKDPEETSENVLPTMDVLADDDIPF